MKRGLICAIVVLAILALALTACGPAATPTPTPRPATPTPIAVPPTPTPVTETLKVGLIAPLSGAGAPWGTAMQWGAEWRAEDINNAGGVLAGGKRYLIKFIPEDDKYTGAGGVTAANKLIFEDKVKFIYGPISSASLLAIQPVTESNKVLVLADTYAREVLGPDKPYTFRIVVTSREHAPVLYKWMVKNIPGLKTVAFTSPNDASGWSVTVDAKEAAAEVRLENVWEKYYERGTTDFYPLLTGMLAKKPDVFDIGAAAPGDQALLVKQAREMGFKGQIIVQAGGDPWTVVKIAGKEFAEGFITNNLDPEGPLTTEKYKQKYAEAKKKFGDIPTLAFITSMYEWPDFLIEGIKKANSIDVEKVKAALESPDYKVEGLIATMTFGGEKKYGIRRQVLGPVFVAVVRDGKPVNVAREIPE